MSHIPGKFVWFEHQSPDPAKAIAFYGALLGWKTQTMPMGEGTYHIIMNGDTGVGGMTTAQKGAPSAWMSYLSVADVDASHKKALSNGAKSLMPPTDFGTVGRAAVIVDPTGACLSLWRDAQPDRPDQEKTPIGDWFWNEHWSENDKRAVAFYKKTFGFGTDTMDMGPGGTYTMLKTKDGKMRAGLMKSNMKGAPTMWLPYIHVADCDAAVAKAKKLGALAIAVPPTDIPNIGRFGIIIDPQGAPVALMKGAG
jgi:predicted enzyme related to lactoylglutathione lyase